MDASEYITGRNSVDIRGRKVRTGSLLWHLDNDLLITEVKVISTGKINHKPCMMTTDRIVTIENSVHNYYSTLVEAEWMANEIRAGEIAYLSDTKTPDIDEDMDSYRGMDKEEDINKDTDSSSVTVSRIRYSMAAILILLSNINLERIIR